MRRFSFFVAMLVAVTPFFFLQCMVNLNSGNGSEVGNGITGILCNADGSRARYEKVAFVPVSYNPKTSYSKNPIAWTRTNDTGAYHFDTLPADTYNIIGGESGTLSYRDSIVIGKSISIVIPNDTLKAAGSISGVIRLQPGDDSRTVLILFLGTKIWQAPSDEIGNFRIENLAEGVYRVRFLTTIANYQALDTSITIKAGIDSVLQDTIRLHYTGIPIPGGLRFTCDSLAPSVPLYWNRADTCLIKGYCVYRSIVDQSMTFDQINLSLITDTVYRDTLVYPHCTFAYKICAVDKGDNKGRLSASVKVQVPAITPEITKEPRDTMLIQSDGITIHSSVRGTRPLTFAWYKDGTNSVICTDSLFRIDTARMADSGFYRYIVSNPSGADTSRPFHITVTEGEPPRIVREPRDTMIYQMEPVILISSITVSGSMPFTFTWYKDNINPGSCISNSADSAFKLCIKKLSDSGLYRCVVSNAFGSDTGRGFHCNVIGKGAHFIRVPKDTAVALGDTAILAYAAQGGGPLTFVLHKDGVDSAVCFDSTCSFNVTFKLHVRQLSDGGTYRCVVRNPLDSQTSQPVYLTVTGAWGERLRGEKSVIALKHLLNQATDQIPGSDQRLGRQVPCKFGRTAGRSQVRRFFMPVAE